MLQAGLTRTRFTGTNSFLSPCTKHGDNGYGQRHFNHLTARIAPSGGRHSAQ